MTGDTGITPDNPGLLARQGRTLVIVGILLFAVSTAFPVVASLVHAEDLPSWVGRIDVGLALLFVIAAFALDGLNKEKPSEHVIRTSYRIYRAMGTLPLVILVIFFLLGSAIRWEILLPGLAWRAWVFMYMLPVALMLWNPPLRNNL